MSYNETHEFLLPSSTPTARNLIIEGLIQFQEPGFLGAKKWVRNFAQVVDDEPMATLRAYSKLDDLIDGKRPRVIYDLSMVIDIIEKPGQEWLELWFANGGIVRFKIESNVDRARWIAHLLRTSPRVRSMLATDQQGAHEEPVGLTSRQLREERLRSARAYAVADPHIAEIVGSHADFARAPVSASHSPSSSRSKTSSYLSPSGGSSTALPPPAAPNPNSHSLTIPGFSLASSRMHHPQPQPNASHYSPSRTDLTGDLALPAPPLPHTHPAHPLSLAHQTNMSPTPSPSFFARDVAEHVSSKIASSVATSRDDAAETRDAIAGLSQAIMSLAMANDATLDRVADLTRLVQGSIAGAARDAAVSASIENKLDAMGAAIMSLTAKVHSMASRAEEHARELRAINSGEMMDERIDTAVKSRMMSMGTLHSSSPRRPGTGPPSTATPNLHTQAESYRAHSHLHDAENVVSARESHDAASNHETSVLRALLEQANYIRHSLFKATGIDVSAAGSAATVASLIPAALRVREDIVAQLYRLRAVEASITTSSAALSVSPHGVPPVPSSRSRSARSASPSRQGR